MKEYYNKCGIYKIKNIKTGDFYVGSSINIGERWETHLSKLKYNKHINKILQNAVNKYGLANFVFGIIEECTKDNIRELEQFYLDIYTPKYNICKLVTGNNSQFTITKEIREKMSNAHKGVPLSKSHSKNISLSLKGRMPKNIEYLRALSRKPIIVWFNDITPILFQDRFEVIEFFGLQKFNYKYISNLCIRGKKLQGFKIEYA